MFFSHWKLTMFFHCQHVQPIRPTTGSLQDELPMADGMITPIIPIYNCAKAMIPVSRQSLLTKRDIISLSVVAYSMAVAVWGLIVMHIRRRTMKRLKSVNPTAIDCALCKSCSMMRSRRKWAVDTAVPITGPPQNATAHVCDISFIS